MSSDLEDAGPEDAGRAGLADADHAGRADHADHAGPEDVGSDIPTTWDLKSITHECRMGYCLPTMLLLTVGTL